MHVKYSHRKMHKRIFHGITCIICSSANRCLRDLDGSFVAVAVGDPVAVLAIYAVLATSVELVQAETEISSLKTDVMITADRHSDLTF